MLFSICTELLCSSFDRARWWRGGGAGLFCISFSAANFVLRVFLGNCLFILFFSEVELTSRSKHKYCVCDVVSDAVMEDFGWCLDIIGGETRSRVVVDVVTV